MKAVVLLGSVCLAGCASPVASLEPVQAAHAPSVRLADVEVRPVVDRRGETAIGRGRDEVMKIGYTVDGDGEVGPWVRSYVESEIVAEGLRGGAKGPRASLAVTMVKFELTENTWFRGVAIFDVSLRRPDGSAAKDRLTIVTSGLMTSDGDAEWSAAAGKLAAWSAHEIARWTRARVLPAEI